MPKPILYDSLLVHYLARELHQRMAGRRLRGLRLDSDARRLILELDDARLVWELHPTRGWIRTIAAGAGAGAGESEVDGAEGWGGRRVRTQRRPRVRGVSAPADERLVAIDLDAGGPDRASRLVVELMTNQWNVLALDPRGVILSALWTRDAGGRALRSGARYAPPSGMAPREGVDEPVPSDRFHELLGLAPESDRRGVLLRSLAWTSSLNAATILAPLPDDVDAAYSRYRALAARPPAHPGVLAVRGGQPYPLPLPGTESRPTDSLLTAFEEAGRDQAPSGIAPEVRTALEERLERVARKALSLAEEAESAPDLAAGFRERANLLMARLRQVPRGATTVELPDFEGGTVQIELDPTLSAVENAEAMYDRARKRERAAARLPARAREAAAERDQLESLLESLDSGTADPAEVARWVADVRPSEGPGKDGAERLPYRTFRSSGGLEIRVGRSGRGNDELTFHHSSPDDIWLHARDMAGAHVILRWGDRQQNPPRRDLLEAAVLAAVNSKGRTSGTVPVDWTRRKHVRSPRNAPPGTVIPDRVATIFVEPDPDVEERLAR